MSKREQPIDPYALHAYFFGKKLLETGDLDPIYILLWNNRELMDDTPSLHKWLLAYFCFYHVGTASWILDQPDYWKAMETAAGSKDYPRSSERRHYRGKNAAQSVSYLKSRSTAVLFAPILRGDFSTAKGLIQYVRTWVGFGPWIAFKVADMVERLELSPKPPVFDFDTAMYDSPLKGAHLLWEQEHGVGAKPGEAAPWAVKRILDQLGHLKSPPRYERDIGMQEVETILCKYHSHVHGHYHVGEDITSCRKGLLRFVKSKTAQKLYQAGKKGRLW